MAATSFGLQVDRTDAAYGRLADFAGRIKTLLDRPKVQADPYLFHALDDFLGAVYALVLARAFEFKDRPIGQPPERDKVQIRAEQVSNGQIRLDGAWMAGFHFNSGIMRLSAVYHRFLRVITGNHKKGQWVEDLLKQLTYSWTPVEIANVHTEVNKLKHDAGGLKDGRDAKFAQALDAVEELLTLLEACPTFR